VLDRRGIATENHELIRSAFGYDALSRAQLRQQCAAANDATLNGQSVVGWRGDSDIYDWSPMPVVQAVPTTQHQNDMLEGLRLAIAA
jgi:hypothetical protein